MKSLLQPSHCHAVALAVCVAACSPVDSTSEVGTAISNMQSGGPPGPAAPSMTPPDLPPQCRTLIDDECMRYRLPLQGNPSTKVTLRNSYIAAFGSACYMSEVDTFDCFYKTWQAACAETPKIGEAAGQQPWDTGYTCQPIGNGDYSLQIGSDVALKVIINYQHAVRQTPLVDINGTPTAVNGPYRDLTEPQGVEPGQTFECRTVGVDAKGAPLTQREWILQVNRKKHGGKVHSDLAGFTWPCGPNDGPPMCMEPLELENPVDPVGTQPQVHHVVPMKDKRSCAWGTNSNKNAAVISQKLNNHLSNHDPPAAEVEQLNSAPAYTP